MGRLIDADEFYGICREKLTAIDKKGAWAFKFGDGILKFIDRKLQECKTVNDAQTEAKDPIIYKEQWPLPDKRYYACPICEKPVGGYMTTGGGEDDWRVFMHNYCPECGQKIAWKGHKLGDLYK